MQFIINTLEELKNVSSYIKNHYWHHKVFALSGPLGVGKTQLVKFLVNKQIEEVSSPTFSLLNIYQDNYWHFDLYKKDVVDLWQMEELGFYTILENKEAKCFIEWPERLSFSLKSINLVFSYENNSRSILIQEGALNE